jgi:hypothetical protein
MRRNLEPRGVIKSPLVQGSTWTSRRRAAIAKSRCAWRQGHLCFRHGRFHWTPQIAHPNATTCIEMANRATERREQAVLFEFARSWMELAWELESDPELRDAVNDVRTFTRRRQLGDWADCFLRR